MELRNKIIGNFIILVLLLTFFSYFYLLEQFKEELMLFLLIGLVQVSCIYLLYLLVKKKQIKNRMYNFEFYLIDDRKSEITNKEFIIYPKNSFKAIIKDDYFLKPKSSKTGKVIIEGLPGGMYQIALREKPRNMLGEFGVKYLHQKQMKWYKTRSKEVKVNKKRRLWIIMKEDVS